MKVLVVGGGSIGLALTAFMSSTGKDVWIAVRRSRQKQLIESQGISVVDPRGEKIIEQAWPRGIMLAMQPFDTNHVFDIVIYATKTYDLESALATTSHLVREDGIVVGVQNGLTHPSILERSYRKSSIVLAVISWGSTRLADNRVCLCGDGLTRVGVYRGLQGSAETVAEILASTGLEVSLSSNIMRDLWLKNCVNAAINSITALVRQRNGCVVSDENLSRTAKIVLGECVAASRRAGYPLDKDEVFRLFYGIADKTALNYSSMLQDILSSRRTEVDAILEPICKLAGGVSCILYDLIKGWESCALAGANLK